MKALKTLLAVLLLAAVGTGAAFASGGRGGHHGGGHRGGGWIAPALIGAGAAYLLTRPGVIYGAPVYTPSCRYVRQQAFDQYGRPMFDQYGQAVTYTVYVCPAPVGY